MQKLIYMATNVLEIFYSKLVLSADSSILKDAMVCVLYLGSAGRTVSVMFKRNIARTLAACTALCV